MLPNDEGISPTNRFLLKFLLNARYTIQQLLPHMMKLCVYEIANSAILRLTLSLKP